MSNRRVWDPSAGAFGALTTGLLWLVVVQAALAVTLLPTAAAFILLERHPSNIVLYALFAIPVGPAIQAGMFALRRGESDGDARPWRRYWEGWRLGWRQSLAVWIPVVAFSTLILINAAYGPAAGVPQLFVTAGLILAGAAVVWSGAALTIVAAFNFRTRDLARVTLYAMGSRPLSTLGVLAMAFLAGVLVLLTFDAVLYLLAVLFCYGLLATVGPMHALIKETLVQEEPDA